VTNGSEARPADPATNADARATAADVLGRLRFGGEWRTYQQLILQLFEDRDPERRTFHVVAPPGSGKTLIGIEIARRLGRPAVTFSPTTTIQEQWQAKVGQFIPTGLPPNEAGVLRAAISSDPARLGVISSLTYQSLSTQTQEREFLDRLGRQAWFDELVASGRDEGVAETHLLDLASKAPGVYARGVALRARRRKRQVLAAGGVTVHELLHPNAIDLVERIVAAGTGCIVLDEAHHLLDYWALILADLIARLPDALVVGLTATPPASADPEALANYLRLVNGIDFEVPTPAVVRNGYLAPYQDLALITRPTERERRFLATQQERLDSAVDRVLGDPRFLPRITERINGPLGDGAPWSALLRDEFDVAIAGIRVLLARRIAIAPAIELVPEMARPPDVDDRLALVREWCLNVLRVSGEPADLATLADLKAAFRTLGLVLTETGWRKAPGPIDRILAYSESKVAAMVRILRAEADSMGERLRAVVLTDFERASVTAQRQLEGVLDPESGGAVQAIRALTADPVTDRLDAAMVTGRTVLVDTDWSDRFLAEARAWFGEHGLHAALSGREVEPGLTLVEGSGPDWRPRHYVACLTSLFERGVTRCLVGTRGLLAEGWDTLRLNTLVDLTTAGTFASVNQIRGRSIRLDPEDPRKVANNWDVACFDGDLDEGRRDLLRLIGRHQHVWGLGPGDRIVKGVAHVDDRLWLLGEPGLPGTRPHPETINHDALQRAARRSKAYDAWGIGQPYDNFIFRATVLSAEPEQLRTAFTWAGSLRALLDAAFVTLVFYALLFWSNGFELVLRLPPPWSFVALAVLVVAPLILAARRFWRYIRAAFLGLPVDSYLADFGRAVAAALRSAGLAAASPEQVRVALAADGTFSVHLDSKNADAVERFATAYRQLFEPIVSQRYLVVRDETSLAAGFYRPWWYVVRGLLHVFRRSKPYYHPVPSIFERKRELADLFAAAWKTWVGGGDLVYTRSPEGIRILLRERAARRLRASTADVEQWR
jgi:superfamily II DNA or RNA helicase